MAKIKIIHDSALNVKSKADLILTDPPFDMDAYTLKEALDNIECNHLVLITTMKQLVDLINCSNWELSFDFVLDAVVPKKSKNINTPNYTHSSGAYLVRNNSGSLFNRKRRQRSDTFDNNGYWPTIIRAPRERLQDHGMAKNLTAVTDLLGSFDASNVIDCFAGSGTTLMAAFELGIDSCAIEIDEGLIKEMRAKFKFLGVE